MIPYINIGKTAISTYWLLLIAGAIGMAICLLHRSKRYHLNQWSCIAIAVLLTVVGFVGAKLLFILENIQSILQNGISLGGVSFYGSVFLIPLLMPLVGKLFHLRSGQIMDLCGPCVAIMIGSMRVGCVLCGCCGGWEMCIGEVCFTWPTQALESIGDFVLLCILLQWEDQNKHPGKLYPLFMCFYSVMRFFIEFLRDTPKDWLSFSHGQWFAAISIFIGSIWLAIAHRSNRVKADDV